MGTSSHRSIELDQELEKKTMQRLEIMYVHLISQGRKPSVTSMPLGLVLCALLSMCVPIKPMIHSHVLLDRDQWGLFQLGVKQEKICLSQKLSKNL